MLRIVVALLLVPIGSPSNAASPGQVKKMMRMLTPSTEPGTEAFRELKVKIRIGGDAPVEGTVVFGRFVKSSEFPEMKREFEKVGLKPWPTKPDLAVLIPRFMCTYFLIDAKSSGVVTHSGKLCPDVMFIGTKSGPGNELFDEAGGPQKLYDTIVRDALKQ